MTTVFDEIESPDFAAGLLLAGAVGPAIRRIRRDHRYARLLRLLEDSHAARGQAVSRVVDFAAEEPEPEMEHSADGAALAYLLALAETEALELPGALSGARRMRRAWWTGLALDTLESIWQNNREVNLLGDPANKPRVEATNSGISLREIRIKQAAGHVPASLGWSAGSLSRSAHLMGLRRAGPELAFDQPTGVTTNVVAVTGKAG